LDLKAKTPVLKEQIHPRLSKAKIILSLTVLMLLIFSKFFYLSSMTNYFTFFLIGKFHVSIQQSQLYLFVFLASVAAGTIIGGFMGDRFGRKYVIWFSILGVAPFTLMLPYANFFWTISPGSYHRCYPLIRLFGHCCICPRTAARQSWHGLRTFFWAGFWHGRPGVGAC